MVPDMPAQAGHHTTVGGTMTFHREGELTTRSCKRHIAYRFEAPEHSGQIEIVLRFDAGTGTRYSKHDLSDRL